MSWGKPVITTAYGGVMQFCDEENSFLVDWRPGRVEETSGPYEKGLPWAEPDLDHAAQLMRAVVDDPRRAAAVGERAARDIREKHSVEAAGARMREVLEEGEAAWRLARAEVRTEEGERRPPEDPADADADVDASRSVLARVRRLVASAGAKARRRREGSRRTSL
jgi:hypothetical protein